MSDRYSDSEAAREALSALADGEAQSQEVTRACAAWRDQPDARAAWHSYQLIGDVMRSEDLAAASDGGDFLRKFQARLAQEPVVLAPSAAQAQREHAAAARAPLSAVSGELKRRGWAGPMSVAAGFALIVGALVSSQILPSGGAASEGSQMAAWGGRDMAASAGTTMALSADGAHGQGFVIDKAGSFNRPGEVLIMRDPQLDQALALQRVAQSGENSFAGQGALVRQAVFDGR